MPAERPRGGLSVARAPASTDGADRVRRAAEALAEAKADARARGDLPAGLRGRPGPDQTNESERTGPFPRGQPGRARRDDPQLLGQAIGGLLDQQGWQQRAAIGSVFGRWAEIVGRDLAAHTQPDAFADGELAVTADSTAWATQVRLLAPQLVRRLNAELGDGTVRRVKVRGPAPPRQRGGLRVPGSRGPRDTYG
ncbi:MAG TPA: DciA family protein [Streptosporangiaceae bacterium]|nr:DciA family protein [Streptosporangiaceae bacterium]